MQKVGLTGIVGSGKSTVGFIISDYGIPFVSADALSRQVISPPGPGYHKLLKLLGTDFLNSDHSWNRQKMAKAAFHNPNLLSQIESIIHPLVLNLMQEEAKKCQQKGEIAVFFEIPLLFEKNLQNFVETSVLIAIESDKQKKFLQKRPDFNLSNIANIMQFQMPQKEKLKKADYIIWNKGSLKDLENQVFELMKKMDFPITKGQHAGNN